MSLQRYGKVANRPNETAKKLTDWHIELLDLLTDWHIELLDLLTDWHIERLDLLTDWLGDWL